MVHPSYDELELALTRVDAVHEPAEVHGILCGLLVHQSSVPADTFVGIVLGKVDDADVLQQETRELLRASHAATLKQLQDPELGFELMLQDDDEPLEQRVTSACQWAGGLLYGLAQQGVRSFQNFSEDTRDFLNDCKEISGGEYEMEGGAEDETIYQELVEYLRLGTLMVQEEMQPVKAPPQLH